MLRISGQIVRERVTDAVLAPAAAAAAAAYLALKSTSTVKTWVFKTQVNWYDLMDVVVVFLMCGGKHNFCRELLRVRWAGRACMVTLWAPVGRFVKVGIVGLGAIRD